MGQRYPSWGPETSNGHRPDSRRWLCRAQALQSTAHHRCICCRRRRQHEYSSRTEDAKWSILEPEGLFHHPGRWPLQPRRPASANVRSSI
ncbi:hypothetical protein ACFPRL_36085 [Pseudoclavibacter helvolus]